MRLDSTMKAKAPVSILSRRIRLAATVSSVAGVALLTSSAFAAEGLLGTGVEARSMGMGGTQVADPESALGSMANNPATLSTLPKLEADFGFVGVLPYGKFTSKTGDTGKLSPDFTAGPGGAVVLPVATTPFTIGIGAVPLMGLSAHWNYRDPEGGLGGLTSYGLQRDNSEIEVIRFSIGASLAITRQLSIGGALNLNYNENLLQMPFIFQSQPVLRGFKTLLDLETSGWGASGSAGISYRPTDTVSLGLSYQGQTTITTHGSASGNASAQLNALGPGFAGVRRDFHYDAEVDNTLPSIVSGGASWKFHPGWVVAGEIDWTGWSDSFDTLPVKLTHGNNRQINGLVGSNALEDEIPLQWKDRFTYRVGLEHNITESFVLRCGYSYSKSPVPSETLTPLTAAIPEHTITVGAGYTWHWLTVDLAYQWDIPATEHVGTSQLADGEFSDSKVKVGVQTVSLTTKVRF